MSSHYRLRNWKQYNNALEQRGSLELWVSAEVLSAWRNPQKSGKRGASETYSDIAIETLLTLKSVYHLKLHQTIGFARSIFKQMGVQLEMPHFTTLSRRAGKLSVRLGTSASAKARHIVIDSTGIKVFGEGEWTCRKHGYSKRRNWLKLHLAIDEASQETG